jgi:hypothetical protein
MDSPQHSCGLGMKHRHSKKAVVIVLASLLILLVCACNVFPGKHIELVIDNNGNLILELNHAGGKPRSIDMRFFVDGREVCPPQRVKRPGLRPCIQEVRVRVQEGRHSLRVEGLGGRITAERDFKVGKKPVYAYATYSRFPDEGTNVGASRLGKLEISFAHGPPGFAFNSPTVPIHTNGRGFRRLGSFACGDAQSDGVAEHVRGAPAAGDWCVGERFTLLNGTPRRDGVP